MPHATSLETFASSGQAASVVVPAHNEQAVIGRFLDRLAPLVAQGEVVVYVVCNGCTDCTAEAASGRPGVYVSRLARAGKVEALREGDRLAGDLFPRLYLDADIVVEAEAVRSVIDVLRTGVALAAAPALRVQTSGRPWLVRRYYDFVLASPWATNALVGSGFYGLSRSGRARFGEFPAVINDDLFVRELFDVSERLSVAGTSFSIEAPFSTWALVKAKARVNSGTRQVVKAKVGPGAPGRQTLSAHRGTKGPPSVASRARRLSAMVFRRAWGRLRRPATWASSFAHSWVRLGAVLLSWSYQVRGTQVAWHQDRTTRAVVRP